MPEEKVTDSEASPAKKLATAKDVKGGKNGLFEWTEVTLLDGSVLTLNIDVSDMFYTSTVILTSDVLSSVVTSTQLH